MPEPTPVALTTFQDQNASNEEIVALKDGGYVVTWRFGSDNVVNIFDDSGNLVSQSAISAPLLPDVLAAFHITALDNGGFALVWQRGDGIGVQAFDATGAAVGDPVVLASSFGMSPQIASLAGGGFVVTAGALGDYPDCDIHAQKFTDGGATDGDAITVNTDGIFLADLRDHTGHEPRLFADPDGGFVTTWSSPSDYTAYATYTAYMQTIDASGDRGSDHDIALYSGDDSTIIDVTYLAGGDYIVTSDGIPGQTSMPVLQRFHADGTPVGDPATPVARFAGPYFNYDSQVVALSDGGYILIWGDDQYLDGDRDSVIAERFDADGNLISAPTLVAYGPESQYFAHLAILDDGKVVLTYSVSDPHNGPRGIYETTYASVDDMFAYTPQLYLNDPWNKNNAVLDGSDYSFIMSGNDGNDTYIVDSSDDQVIERNSEGNDTVMSSVTFVTHGGQYIENIVLTGTDNINATGNGQANHLTGNSGDNVLNGLQGADIMHGGAGDDTYYVDNAGDVASEQTVAGVDDGGNDAVVAAVSYTIGDFIERLSLTGYNAINGTGNASDNTMSGNGAANMLNGMDGNDWLRGGGGNDTLTGGAGADTFVFEHPGGANGLDHITDFVSGEDKLSFHAADFGLATGAVLAGDQFSDHGRVGTDGQFLYNTTTHTLYWDPDGTGPQGAVSIVVFDNAVTLHASDFIFT